MLYSVTAHLLAGELRDAALGELREGLERAGLQVDVLRLEDGPDGQRYLHLTSPVEAVSGYDARRVVAPPLLAGALAAAGVPTNEQDLVLMLTPEGEEHGMQPTS
jgi:hypothetical protein